jgi:hypothetical protein
MSVLSSEATTRGEVRTTGFLASQIWQNRVIKLIAYILLTVGGLTMIVPFIWMISTSMKTAAEIFDGNFFPIAPTLENYRSVIFDTPFPRWYLNSLIVAIISTTSVRLPVEERHLHHDLEHLDDPDGDVAHTVVHHVRRSAHRSILGKLLLGDRLSRGHHRLGGFSDAAVHAGSPQ